MVELVFFPKPSEDERNIREVTRAFVKAKLRPYAVEDDEKKIFRREVYNELAALKLHCLSIPKSLGGKGLSSRCHYACLEEIARGSASMTVAVGVSALPLSAIMNYGTDQQKKAFLNHLVSGEWLGAFSLSEPQSGSDAASLQCQARKTENGYILNGNKLWCSTAGHADLYLVIARIPDKSSGEISAFLVPKNTTGFRVGKHEKKLGLNASSLAELIFDDCFIPKQQLLGKEGDGLKIAFSQLDTGRITIGAVGAALCIESLEKAWSFFSARVSRGIPFESGIRHELASLYTELQGVKNLVGIVSDLKDEGKPITLLASQVKLLGSDLAMKTTSQVVQLLGPEGCMRANEVERLMRDAKALQIVEGTNQIQKEIIAREMDRMEKT